MVNKFYCSISIMLLCFSIQSLAQTKIYRTNNGEISFFSETPLENIDAYSESMSSAIKPVNKDVAAVVLITSFKFKNALMQEHFNEKYLESDKYPKATFAGVINEDIDFKKPGSYKITVTGKLTLHGVEQKRTINGLLTIDPNLKLKMKSDFTIKLVDHKIEVPQLVVTKIAETIRISIIAEYELR